MAGREKDQHIKAQTLRLYNPDSHQWRIYLLDLDKGALSLPPVIGEFSGRRKDLGSELDLRVVTITAQIRSAISNAAVGGQSHE